MRPLYRLMAHVFPRRQIDLERDGDAARFLAAARPDRDFFRRYRITHLKGVFLYFTACDADGNAVTVRDERGAAVEGYNTAGCYNCAAAAYDRRDQLTPETVLYPAVPTEH